MNLDMNASSQTTTASPSDTPADVNLAELNLGREQVSKIRQEAVKSAILSVIELRQGHQRCDSLTLSEWGKHSSSPGPSVY